MATVTICSDFEAQENEIFHCFHFSPFYLPWNYVSSWSLANSYFFFFLSSFTTSRLAYACVHVELLQSCLTLCDPMDSSSCLCCPWGSPGKNAGVCCHAFLQWHGGDFPDPEIEPASSVVPALQDSLPLIHWGS